MGALLLAGCPPSLGGNVPVDGNPAGADTLASPGPEAPSGTIDMPSGSPDQPIRRMLIDMSITPRVDARAIDMRLSHPDAPLAASDAFLGMSCDPSTQNCTSGEKCAFTFSPGATSPSDVCTTNGTVATGGACSDSTKTFGIDNCKAGSICWLSLLAPPASGTCRAYCTSDASCASGQKCTSALSTSTTTLGACLPTCTLGGSCPSATACNVDIDVDTKTIISNCQAYGTATTGATCKSNTDCVAGDACLGSGTTSNCTKLCNLSGSGSCPSGMTCMPLCASSTSCSTTLGYCG